ncbi:MAG: ACT domain-containing protein [Candidatus Methanosuratincola sp.]|jgi:glutamine phosphoribosylpyrophosphate amidotransferase|uniref:Glutamine amidotransferase protein GlxB n=1 Tax=Methanosuratincola subterraneus TaxID=2593994 RepID=A0A444L5A6_METS7|nr:ACT domain-containing protein [Candidatus Methanosuratincola sp.]RWX72766.1 MAG: Glutamine amidotransferase protein GlxB [Candidatus Methanosuratincola subterraneus]
MCGIAGVLLNGRGDVGHLLTLMLGGLQHRGLDSAGVALYRSEELPGDEFMIRVFTKDVIGALSKISSAIARAGGDIRNIKLNSIRGYSFDLYTVKAQEKDLPQMVKNINETELSKVLSIGRKMDIIKDTVSVEELDRNFDVSSFVGSHGIGHVRFSTESCVDLFHAHPFQSFDHIDVALVHNGQITNYWKTREKLEQKGVKFQTENDSELIVHYIIDRLKAGDSLYDALKASVEELDGPFSYIFSTEKELGMVRDKLGLRPMVILDAEEMKAVASEENALRILNRKGIIRNVRPGEVICWKIA